jgi:hypothetical protein
VQSIAQHIRSEPAGASSPLTAPEVRQLWWFLDGAIMHADTRMALRQSWGLCPRHAWGMAEVECALRGGVIFATSVLYADLVAGAAGVAGGRHLRSLARRVEPDGPCLTCQHVEHSHDAPPEWVERAEIVNRRRRFMAMLEDSWPEAAHRACGACVGGDGPTCHPHLLQGESEPDDLAPSLAHLAVRMHAYEKSLTADGRPVDRRGRAAWIETLAWFGGWRFPAVLVGALTS